MYIDFKSVDGFHTRIYMMIYDNFKYNDIWYKFGLCHDVAYWWYNMIILYDDLCDDEMSWGHGDGYVVLLAPMDDLW